MSQPLDENQPYEVRPAKWGMAVDLDRCTGCNTCVTACSMENNIAWVGDKEAAYRRSLHWIRLQRYWNGEFPDIRPSFIPVLCQQCGAAPCEPVCPVYASVHSLSEELNLQVYNRCIGTRECGVNCPYSNRVFNFYDWETPEPFNLYLNPDVTRRRRGVMEKCTFCLQRLRRAQEDARLNGRTLQEGEVLPACAQACPTNALIFGSLLDTDSQVSRLSKSERAYILLPEQGTSPRVTYLAGQNSGTKRQV